MVQKDCMKKGQKLRVLNDVDTIGFHYFRKGWIVTVEKTGDFMIFRIGDEKGNRIGVNEFVELSGKTLNNVLANVIELKRSE